MALKLSKATRPSFDVLRTQWDEQLRMEDAPPLDVYEPMMEHAVSVIENRPNDNNYGIYVIKERRCNHPIIYHGFTHICYKLPQTSDATLKILWKLLAPRLQYECDEVQLARIMMTLVAGAFNLSRSHMPARQIKMYLGNSIDREFAVMAAAFLERSGEQIAFAIRAGWLHISAT